MRHLSHKFTYKQVKQLWARKAQDPSQCEHNEKWAKENNEWKLAVKKATEISNIDRVKVSKTVFNRA